MVKTAINIINRMTKKEFINQILKIILIETGITIKKIDAEAPNILINTRFGKYKLTSIDTSGKVFSIFGKFINKKYYETAKNEYNINHYSGKYNFNYIDGETCVHMFENFIRDINTF